MGHAGAASINQCVLTVLEMGSYGQEIHVSVVMELEKSAHRAVLFAATALFVLFVMAKGSVDGGIFPDSELKGQVCESNSANLWKMDQKYCSAIMDGDCEPFAAKGDTFWWEQMKE